MLKSECYSCVAMADDGVVVSDPAGFAYGYSTEGGYTICTVYDK